MRVALALTVCLACVPAVEGQVPPAPPKAKVEFRWVEGYRVEGLTEDKGFQSSCDPESIVYPHKNPVLVLTSADVAEVRLTQHDFSRNGLSSENFLVTLHLTKKARDTLAAAYADEESRLLTIRVDGKNWGVHRYEKRKEKEFVPAKARAETFTPSVGFFSSKAEAERLVEAFK